MSDSYDPTLLPTLMEMRSTWTTTDRVTGEQKPSSDMSIWDFVAFKGSPELAYGYASVFWPEFVEAHGGVFLAERFNEDSFEEWNQAMGRDLGRIEAMMNHCHLEDTFPDYHGTPLSYEADVRIARCWHRAGGQRSGSPSPTDRSMLSSIGKRSWSPSAPIGSVEILLSCPARPGWARCRPAWSGHLA